MTTVRRVGIPSPSNGAVPKPPGMVPSSITLTFSLRNLLPQLVSQERCAAIDRIAIHAFKMCSRSRVADERIKYHRHMRRLNFLCAQAPQSALGRNFANVLGRFQPAQGTGYGKTSSRAA